MATTPKSTLFQGTLELAPETTVGHLAMEWIPQSPPLSGNLKDREKIWDPNFGVFLDHYGDFLWPTFLGLIGLRLEKMMEKKTGASLSKLRRKLLLNKGRRCFQMLLAECHRKCPVLKTTTNCAVGQAQIPNTLQESFVLHLKQADQKPVHASRDMPTSFHPGHGVVGFDSELYSHQPAN